MSSRETRPPSLRPIVLAGAAGNVVEWYDFALYGYFAPLIGAHFFPATGAAAAGVFGGLTPLVSTWLARATPAAPALYLMLVAALALLIAARGVPETSRQPLS